MSSLEAGLDPYVFLLAILIAKEVYVDSLYLGSLYAQLDDCVNNVIWFVGRYQMVAHVNACFLQMFL